MKKPSSAGQLDKRVCFDARIEVDDGYGNKRGRWQEKFTRSAGFTFLRGGEGVIAGRLEGRQPIVVRLRADSDTRQIKADWRMRDTRNGSWADAGKANWTGPVYAVRSVAETSDRRFLDIMVEEGVAA